MLRKKKRRSGKSKISLKARIERLWGISTKNKSYDGRQTGGSDGFFGKFHSCPFDRRRRRNGRPFRLFSVNRPPDRVPPPPITSAGPVVVRAKPADANAVSGRRAGYPTRPRSPHDAVTARTGGGEAVRAAGPDGAARGRHDHARAHRQRETQRSAAVTEPATARPGPTRRFSFVFLLRRRRLRGPCPALFSAPRRTPVTCNVVHAAAT